MSEEKNKNDYEIEDEFDDSEEFSFWSFRTIFTLFLIVLLIGAGIYSFNKNPEESIDDKVADLEEENKDSEVKSEENKEESKSEESKENATKSEENKDSEVKSEENKTESKQTEEVKSTGEKVSVVTQSGEGVTNLARKAIADYISKNNIELSVEQKLFSETYIKDLYKSKYKGLNTGDMVEFDSADITNTVNKAKDLSEGQIKAWSKYVALVPSLK